MKQQGNWLFLDLNKLSIVRKEVVNGVVAHIAPAPFDLPIAVRPSIDSEKHSLHIEIRYSTNAESHRVLTRNGVTFLLGKESGRLHGLDFAIPLDKSFDDGAKNQLLENMESGLRNLMSDRRNAPRPENYRVLKEILGVAGRSILNTISPPLALAN